MFVTQEQELDKMITTIFCSNCHDVSVTFSVELFSHLNIGLVQRALKSTADLPCCHYQCAVFLDEERSDVWSDVTFVFGSSIWFWQLISDKTSRKS